MEDFDVKVGFNPRILESGSRNEVVMDISVRSQDQKPYWCECDIKVSPPVSLAHDKDLPIGRTRIGIVTSVHALTKQVKIYTSQDVVNGDYQITLTVYMYDEDGAISARKEINETIRCSDIADKEIVN
jgi:hypothetical protein